MTEIKSTIFGHAEFTAFQKKANRLFDAWKETNTPRLKGFKKDSHPRKLIETIAEDLLETFKKAPLLDGYDLYQHLMVYWAETMQDDCYLIAADGWKQGAQPREIVQVKNKENKLVWPEKHDFKRGKRRFKSDLVPASILIGRYFTTERDNIAKLQANLADIDQQLDEKREEQSGEEGLLNEVIEGEGDKQKITAKAVKARLKEIGKDPDYADERAALVEYAALLDKKDKIKASLKTAEEGLEAKLDAKYPKLTEDEVKTLVVDDKWLTHIAGCLRERTRPRFSKSDWAHPPACRAIRYPIPVTHQRSDCHVPRRGKAPQNDGGDMGVRLGYKKTEVGIIPEDWGVIDAIDLEPFITSGSRGWAKYYAGSGRALYANHKPF